MSPAVPTSPGRREEARAGWLFVAPALAAIAVFFLVPVGAALLLSLTDFDLYALRDAGNARFVGLGNFRALLANPLFWKAVVNSLLFVGVGVPLTMAVSLAGALLVNARLARLRWLWRTLFFAPVVTTLVAVAIVWRYLYHPQVGWLNRLAGGLGLPAVDWLGDPRFALLAVVLMSVWKNFGYGLVIFVAGLQAIPESLYEAARLDGAPWWRQQLHITLPLLRPMLVFVAVITTIGYFQLFAEPYVMTRGGPLNATLSVPLLMYQEGFRWWNLGPAAAVAFVLFAMILAVTGLQLLLRREEPRQ